MGLSFQHCIIATCVTSFIIIVCSLLQQAWCQQILVDLVHCLHMYFLSAETVVWKDGTQTGQSVVADSDVPINRNISRTR